MCIADVISCDKWQWCFTTPRTNSIARIIIFERVMCDCFGRYILHWSADRGILPCGSGNDLNGRVLWEASCCLLVKKLLNNESAHSLEGAEGSHEQQSCRPTDLERLQVTSVYLLSIDGKARVFTPNLDFDWRRRREHRLSCLIWTCSTQVVFAFDILLA